jgi:hypothetical protein
MEGHLKADDFFGTDKFAAFSFQKNGNKTPNIHRNWNIKDH